MRSTPGWRAGRTPGSPRSLAAPSNTVGRLRSGEIAISVERLRLIELHLGMEAGQLLDEAGYFDPPSPAKVVNIAGVTRRTATKAAPADPAKKRAAKKKPPKR